VREPRPRVARVATSISLNLILLNQMRYLRDDGFDVVCVCDDDGWAERLRGHGFEVWPLGMGRRPGPVAAAAWALRFHRLLRARRVDVVHTHNAFHGIAGRFAARAARVPVVAQTVHNWWYLDPAQSRGSRPYRLLERLAARCSDAVFFINRDDHERALRERIVADAKRHFIGNGIDVAGFGAEVARVDRTAVRGELGIDATAPVVTMIARLEPPKDHDQMLDAFSRVRRELPAARLLLAGYGMRRDAIVARAQSAGLDGSVSFLGYRDDIAALVAASDVVALASRQEGFGRALVEAMVGGVPVVGTDVVGIRDVIRDGETGLLVPPGDADALAAALLRLLRDGALRASLAERARCYAEEHFDERDAARRIAAVYRELLA
jgi:glycosyltransferase involved in cell wall biosynthesis